MSLTLPDRWQGCEHVVTCIICLGSGCRSCGKRGVMWNRRTLPENMLLRGYRVEDGACWFTPSGSTGGGFALNQSQVCAGIWELDGPTIPPAPPIDRSLLDGPALTDEQINAVAQVGGVQL